jgi:hypothetical protein
MGRMHGLGRMRRSHAQVAQDARVAGAAGAARVLVQEGNERLDQTISAEPRWAWWSIDLSCSRRLGESVGAKWDRANEAGVDRMESQQGCGGEATNESRWGRVADESEA